MSFTYLLHLLVTKFPNLCRRFIFLEFKSPEDAAYAIGAMSGHPFDSKHRFSVNRFTDIERYADIDETYTEPEPEPYVQKVNATRIPPANSALICLIHVPPWILVDL